MLWAVIVALVVVGVVLYCINKFVPMEPNIKQMLNVVVILIMAWYLLDKFGLIAKLQAIG